MVFGGSTVGSDGVIPLGNLNGKNGFILDGEFTNDNSGGVVSRAGDINRDGVDDFLIGAYRHKSNTGRTYVVFGDAPPLLTRNQLSLSPGEHVLLTPDHLAATDRNHPLNSLLFVPGHIQHGRFAFSNTSDLDVFNFTQPQIAAGEIQFIHDGGAQPPAYQISVYSPGIAWCAPESATVQFDTPGHGMSAGSVAGIILSVGIAATVLGYLIYRRRKSHLPHSPDPVITDIQWDDLKFGPKIGEGGYGEIYRGTYQFNQVAIKKLKTDRLSVQATEELKREAKIMAMMRSDYIVQWRGACFEASRVCR